MVVNVQIPLVEKRVSISRSERHERKVRGLRDRGSRGGQVQPVTDMAGTKLRNGPHGDEETDDQDDSDDFLPGAAQLLQNDVLDVAQDVAGVLYSVTNSVPEGTGGSGASRRAGELSDASLGIIVGTQWSHCCNVNLANRKLACTNKNCNRVIVSSRTSA